MTDAEAAGIDEECCKAFSDDSTPLPENDKEGRPNQSEEPRREPDNSEGATGDQNHEDVDFLIQETNRRLDHERQKNARLEGVLAGTEKHFIEQMRKMHEEKAEMEAQIRKLTTEKTRLMSDLEESKNVLFELRPEEQVSDAEIQRRYTGLCNAIETWIDIATGGDNSDDFGPRFLKLWKKMRKPNLIYNVLGDLESDFPMLAAHDNFDYFVLTTLIQGLLDAEMTVRYPIGVSQKVLIVLKEVQRSMAMLEPPKDKSYIDMWRSDALKALVAIKEVKDARDARAEESTQYLMSILKPLLSKTADFEALETKLFENVLKPAFELSQMMAISTHRYGIHYSKKIAGSVFKDLDGWTTVKKMDQIERVVRRLHPALVLLDRGEQFPIVLVKQVVVASLRESGEP